MPLAASVLKADNRDQDRDATNPSIPATPVGNFAAGFARRAVSSGSENSKPRPAGMGADISTATSAEPWLNGVRRYSADNGARRALARLARV